MFINVIGKRFVLIAIAFVLVFANLNLSSASSLGSDDLENLDKMVGKVDFVPNQLFHDAEMNEVIIYLPGQTEITKRDVLSGDFLRKFATYSAKLEKMRITLPSGRTQAISEEITSTPRFGQTVERLWLPNLEGARFASKIEANISEQVAAFVTSFIPKVGWIVALPWGINILIRANLASKIRTITDQGYPVEIARIKTTYGILFAVNRWSGSSIEILKPVVIEDPHHRVEIKTSYSFK